MDIPNGETLFRFVAPQALPLGQSEIPLGIFNDPELSCDWERYRNDPYTSYHINEGKEIVVAITVTDAIKFPRNPKRAGQKVEDWEQKVIHQPITDEQDPIHGANDAHSLIQGRKKLPVKVAIRESARFWDRG